MALFNEISPTSGNASIEAACKALVEQVRSSGLTVTEWSLAELHSTPDDFHWLQQWARHLDAPTLRYWLLPESPAQQVRRTYIGSLLLLFAAEYARRALPREGAWSTPTQYSFGATARPLLFANGEPTPQHLQGMREAAVRLKLRQALLAQGEANGFNGFLSLQIGVTAAQIEGRLAQWFAGASLPISIKTLLDPRQGNRVFQELWWCCQLFRDHEIPASTFRQLLTVNPWVLPEWHEQIIAALVVSTTVNAQNTVTSPALPIQVNHSKTKIYPIQSQDIFDDLTPFGGVKTIVKAVRNLEQRIRQLDLGQAAWSLAELRASDYDYLWLRVWVKRLEPHTFDYCSRTKLRAAFGLLFWLWMVETARREAIEGELWPHLADGHFDPATQELLFVRGYPTPILREMLRTTVESFRLRNALNQPSVQHWLDTAFLQFGFTARGFKDRLPEWLTRQATTRAIESLLNDSGGSVSFGKLWEDLRAYRRNQITESQLKATLESSPWILPEWTDELISSTQASNAAIAVHSIALTQPDSFLTTPVLHWPQGGQPKFVTQIATDLSQLQLADDCYDLRIGGRLVAQLLQQKDGSYLPVPSRTILLDFDQPLITASLVNPQGEVVKSNDLEMWPEGEDIVLYRQPSGECLPDAFDAVLSHNVSYALLIAEDLALEPELPEWRVADSRRAKIYRLPTNWSAQTRVLLDGELLWAPNLRQHPAKPRWATDTIVDIAENQSIKWGQDIQVNISHLREVAVRRVSWQGTIIQCSRISPTAVSTEPLRVFPGLPNNRLDLRLSLEKDGQRCTLRFKLDLKIIGTAHLTDAGWRALNRHSTLTVEQARRDLFKIILPNPGTQSLKIEELFLFEGDGAYHKLPRHIAPLGQLHGWGAPLHVRPRFYAKFATLELAGSAVWHGELDDAICESLPDGSAQLLRLRFRRQIKPGEEHAIIWWDASGNIIPLKPKYCDEAEGAWWWVCELPEQCTKLIAVAVAYQGQNLGSWWVEREWLLLLRALSNQPAKRVAALLRWFHLPLLSPSALAELRSLVEHQAADFLCAWIQDEGLPEGLVSPSKPTKDEVWLAVVSKAFQKWQPDTKNAQQILMTLAKTDDANYLGQYLSDAANYLLAVDPLLLAKVLKVWSHSQRIRAIQELRLLFANCDNAAEANKIKAQLIEEVSTGLSVNRGLIESKPNGLLERATHALLGGKLEKVYENNLALAVRQPLARRLLAIHLLEQIK